MNFRQYQTDQIDKVVEELSVKRKVLAQLPTGGGKTVEFALITKRYILKQEKAVLILVHRQELLYQAEKTIQEVTGFKPYLITSKTKKFNVARVYIGMVESVKNRLNLFHNVGLVIVDECHIASFNKIHTVFLNELILGYTATPIAASKHEPLNKYFHSIVLGPQISELISMGYLAKNVTRCPSNIVDSTKLEIDKLKGDFNEGQMAMEYSKPKHIMNLVKVYSQYCHNKKTLVFNVNIAHSKEVTQTLELAGFNARHIDGTVTDDERKEILQWFKETPDAILNNVMIATVGFDEPTVESVILNYSTLSLPKFIQCAGRGGRIIDEYFINKWQHAYPYNLNEKYYFDLIDMGGNCIRFGDWSDDRNWKYIFNNPDKPGEGGIAPGKICPSCEGYLHAAVRVCSLLNSKGEVCGHEFTKKPQKEEELGEMLIITKNIDVKDLIQRSSHKFDYFPFFHMGEQVVHQLYDQHSNPTEKQKMDAFEDYFKLCCEWHKAAMSEKSDEPEDISTSAWHIRCAREHFNKLLKKQQLTFNF